MKLRNKEIIENSNIGNKKKVSVSQNKNKKLIVKLKRLKSDEIKKLTGFVNLCENNDYQKVGANTLQKINPTCKKFFIKIKSLKDTSLKNMESHLQKQSTDISAALNKMKVLQKQINITKLPRIRNWNKFDLKDKESSPKRTNEKPTDKHLRPNSRPSASSRKQLLEKQCCTQKPTQTTKEEGNDTILLSTMRDVSNKVTLAKPQQLSDVRRENLRRLSKQINQNQLPFESSDSTKKECTSSKQILVWQKGKKKNYVGKEADIEELLCNQVDDEDNSMTKSSKINQKKAIFKDKNKNSKKISNAIKQSKKGTTKSLDDTYDFASSGINESEIKQDVAADIIKKMINENKVNVATNWKGKGRLRIKRPNEIKIPTQNLNTLKKNKRIINTKDVKIHNKLANASEELNVKNIEEANIPLIEVDDGCDQELVQNKHRIVFAHAAKKPSNLCSTKLEGQHKELPSKYALNDANKLALDSNNVNMSPIPLASPVNKPSVTKPWRVSEKSHLPTVFNFTIDSQNLPTFSSDYIPSSQTMVVEKNASESEIERSTNCQNSVSLKPHNCESDVDIPNANINILEVQYLPPWKTLHQPSPFEHLNSDSNLPAVSFGSKASVNTVSNIAFDNDKPSTSKSARARLNKETKKMEVAAMVRRRKQLSSQYVSTPTNKNSAFFSDLNLSPIELQIHQKKSVKNTAEQPLVSDKPSSNSRLESTLQAQKVDNVENTLVNNIGSVLSESYCSNDSNIENRSPSNAVSLQPQERIFNLRQQPNPRRSLKNRSPLKPINIQEVVCVPLPNPSTPLNKSSENLSDKLDLFGFEEFLTKDNGKQSENTSKNVQYQYDLNKKLKNLKRKWQRNYQQKAKQLPIKTTLFDENSKQNQRTIKEMLTSTLVQRNQGEAVGIENETSMQNNKSKLFQHSDFEHNLTDENPLQRTYIRPKRKKTPKKDANFIFFSDSDLSDEEKEPVQSAAVKRTRKMGTKPDTKDDEELNSFVSAFNALCNEVDQYELIIEKSASET